MSYVKICVRFRDKDPDVLLGEFFQKPNESGLFIWVKNPRESGGENVCLEKAVEHARTKFPSFQLDDDSHVIRSQNFSPEIPDSSILKLK